MYVQLLYQVLILQKQKLDNKKTKATKKGELSETDDEDIFMTKQRQRQLKMTNPDTKDGHKYQIYNLLYDLIKRREEAIDQFKLDHNITIQTPIPKYEVPWVSYWLQRSESML